MGNSALLPLDPTIINDVDPTCLVGGLYEDKYGRLFRYVKNGSADTNAVQYKLAAWMTGGVTGVVTMKASEVTSGGLGTVTKGAGIWQAAVSFGRYGFIGVMHDNGYVYTDDGVADGDPLVMDGGATETFIADTAGAGEEHGVFGHANADDNDTTHLVLARYDFL